MCILMLDDKWHEIPLVQQFDASSSMANMKDEEAQDGTVQSASSNRIASLPSALKSP